MFALRRHTPIFYDRPLRPGAVIRSARLRWRSSRQSPAGEGEPFQGARSIRISRYTCWSHHGQDAATLNEADVLTVYQVFTALTFGAAGWFVGISRSPQRMDAGPSHSREANERAETTSTTPLSRSLKPDHDVSMANLRSAREKLAAVVGEANIDSRLDEIQRHTGSEWSSHPGSPDEAPAAIVRPGSTEEVSKVMKVCHDMNIPVVAFSGGTSLEGHFANTRRGISLDLGRMNKILGTHEKDLDVVVQPGLGYEELNEALAQQVSKTSCRCRRLVPKDSALVWR